TLDKSIKAEGWHNWDKPEAEKTSFYAEYNSRGDGASITQRVKWAHTLTPEIVENEYSISEILKGKDNWDPTLKLKTSL
ncbi:MAG: pectinesterase family protein, partial [Leeuwenhoekiella sp.]